MWKVHSFRRSQGAGSIGDPGEHIVGARASGGRDTHNFRRLCDRVERRRDCVIVSKQEPDDKTRRPIWSFLDAGERRESRRALIAKLEVEVRLEQSAEDPDWSGTAVDINASGLALVLPPELAPGTRVYLTFQLGGSKFSRLPGLVVRQDRVGVGAVEFEHWETKDQMRLRTFLEEQSAPP